MSLYITAQLVGFLGFLLLTSAPYFKNKDTFIKVDILACVLLSLQWFMLAQPGLAVMNMLNVAHSAGVLKAKNSAYIKKAMPLFYPISLVILLLVSKGTIIDALCIIGFFSLMKAKNSKDMLTFRGYALSATVVFTYAGYLALSIPSMLFETLRIFIHGYRLIELLQPNKIFARQIKVNA